MGRVALTAREQEVLDCVRQGMSDREIAESLGIAHGTVRAHITSIAAKVPGGDERRPRLKILQWLYTEPASA